MSELLIMFGCLIILQLCMFPSNAIFSKSKHHESQYMDKKYSIPLENSFNLTKKETLFIEKLQHIHELAHCLIDTLNNTSVEFSSIELEEIETNKDILNDKIQELKIEVRHDGLQLSRITSQQLYKDTIDAIIKYSKIELKLLLSNGHSKVDNNRINCI